MRDRVKSVFVDGRSTDGTFEYLQSHVSNTDNAILVTQYGTGLYQALNQGIRASIDDPDVTHIGVLHSDDELIPETFERYMDVVSSDASAFFYSGIEFHDQIHQRVRVWEADKFSKLKLYTGWMPPHTSVIVKKVVYSDFGLYDPKFGTAADYEWMVRVLRQPAIETRCFPERTLSMLVGGASSVSFRARLRANAMDGRVWAESSLLHSGIVRICKPLRKVGQFFVRG